MEIKRLTVGKLAANCYLLISGKELAVIDPGGEPDRTLKEIEKSEGWQWYGLSKLPKPLFWMAKLAVDSRKTKSIYFDE